MVHELRFSNEMTGDCLFCQTVSPPSFVWEIVKDQLEEGPWISSDWEHLHMGESLIWLHNQREKNQAPGINSQKFSFNRRYLRFPKSSLSSCLVLCSLACIHVALKKSPFIVGSSSQVPRSYQNCVSQILSLYWVKIKINKTKSNPNPNQNKTKLETIYIQCPVQKVK